MMNLLEINQRIKQRPPFQMIERVTELEPNVSATGIKNVSVNEPYFAGHFPTHRLCREYCSLNLRHSFAVLYLLPKVLRRTSYMFF